MEHPSQGLQDSADAPETRHIPVQSHEIDELLNWQKASSAQDGLVHDPDVRNSDLLSPIEMTVWQPTPAGGVLEVAPAANAPYALIDEIGTGAFSNVGIIKSRPMKSRPWDAIPSGLLIGVNNPPTMAAKSEQNHDNPPSPLNSSKNGPQTMSPSKSNILAFTKEASPSNNDASDESVKSGEAQTSEESLPLDLPALQSAGFASEDVAPGKLAATPAPAQSDLAVRIAAFWAWFNANDDRLYSVELDASGHVTEEHMDTIVLLAEECAKIHEDLSVEIENAGTSGTRRLVISANGLTDVFPVVEEAVDQSRTSSRWEVVKYRQRQERINALSLKGHTIRPQDVRFGVARHKGTGEFGVFVFIPGFNEEELDVWRHLGFIFLDLALGEFDVATKVTSVEFGAPNSLPHVNQLTITELPVVFDYLFNKSRH